MVSGTGRALLVGRALGVALLSAGLVPSAAGAQAAGQGLLLAQAVAQAAPQPAAPAQKPRGTGISMGGLKVSADIPVEVTADELQVDQNANTATFRGNVLVIQGDLRLTSQSVLVEYGMPEGEERPNQIYRLTASGGVVMSSPTESAEGEQAVYTIADKQMVMTGDVAVTQGSNIVTGQRMVVNLDDGTAVMEGRVRTIIDTSKPAKAPAKTPANASAGGASGGAQ